MYNIAKILGGSLVIQKHPWGYINVISHKQKYVISYANDGDNIHEIFNSQCAYAARRRMTSTILFHPGRALQWHPNGDRLCFAGNVTDFHNTIGLRAGDCIMCGKKIWTGSLFVQTFKCSACGHKYEHPLA